MIIDSNTNKMFKYYNIIILIFCFSFFELYSENVGQIYSFEFPDDKIIYFGPCLKGNTEILNFIIESYLPDTTLIIIPSSPTFILSTLTSTDDHHTSFSTIVSTINSFPFFLNANKLIDTIKIPFTAITTEPTGRREAELIIGFLYSDDFDSKSDTAIPALHIDTFVLIGKNTIKYLDGYDDFVKFDSVFINQATPVIKKFKVKNTFTKNINAISQEWNLISQQFTDQEFFIEDKNETEKYPLTFYAEKEFREWNIGYSPKDLFADTAEFRIIFIPNENEPNKFDTVTAKLYGVGVKQSFNVVNESNCIVNENADIIDIGTIRVGSTKTASVTLRNVGNINYKLVKQNIYDEINDTPVGYFQLKLPFCDENSAMKINDIDSFLISFIPDRKGTFIARYVLENDFKDRKILSNNISDYKKTIILKGIGVEPILQLEKDTIDFGNVSYANNNVECPTQKDTIITLFNIGNSELIINDIKTNNVLFKITPSNISIPANSSEQITITFISNYPEDSHDAILIFETPENILPQTITLLGKSIPPITASLSIPHLSVKPGTILEVPIELKNIIDNSSASQYASNFSIYLKYNPALLSYIDYRTIGTASEGCNIDTNEIGNGELEINGAKLFSTLEPNTTLLNLRFKTFLGDKPNTEITIENAKLGINNLCEDYISLRLQNGSYSIDSICGLEYKLNDIGKNKYDYEIMENNLGQIEIDFTLPFEVQVQFSICNYLGNELLVENYVLQQGRYLKTIPLTNFNSGIYYTIFRAGLYYKMLPFVKK